jgi:hypothetical protein
MAETSRVDDLRKRYHENPRRFFAPLANEYRKSGFLDRALLLCEKHLGEQPGNMNGLIVYGQTLFEAGRHVDARGPFEAALELDPENLIALRHLGDIARLGEDHEEARRWYGRALEFDRRNEEVRALFAQVDGTIAEPGSGPSIRWSEVTPRDAAFHSAKTVEITPRPLAEVKTLEVTPRPLAEAETVEITPPIMEPLSEPMSASPAEAESVPAGEPASAPPAGFTPGGFTSADALDLVLEDDFGSERSAAPVPEAPPAPPAPSAPPRPRASLLDISFDFGDSASADAASAPTPGGPLLGSDAAEYGFPASFPTLDEPESPDPRRSEPLFEPPPEPISLTDEVTAVDGLQLADFSADVEPLSDLEPGEFSGDTDDIAPLADLEPMEFLSPESESPLAPTPAAGVPTFVTETMAKLYLEQGFRAEAIEVYRKLVAQDPADTTMQQKLQDLEAASRVSVEFEAPSAPDEMPGQELTFLEEAASAPAPDDNAMLADVSFADVALDTPSSAPRVPTPAAAPRIPTPAAPPAAVGPSAREFFSAFVHRTAAARNGVADAPARDAVPAAPAGAAPHTYSGESYAIPPALSSLDGMFGVEVNQDDQRAANQLSGVGTTTAPSGTSSLDTLFGAESPSAPRPRGNSPRASEKLKFDQFFTSTSTPPPATPVAPSVEPPSAAEPASTEPPTADGDDDLDQFHGWLKGLTS